MFLSTFKILQSCLYKRSLNWKRNKTALKKCCMIFKSGSDAPYTERQYVKFGGTKDLNRKQSISTCEYCSFLRDLKTCKHLFTLSNFCLTCSLSLQLLYIAEGKTWQTVTLWDIANLLILHVIVLLPNNEFLAFAIFRVRSVLTLAFQRRQLTKMTD